LQTYYNDLFTGEQIQLLFLKNGEPQKITRAKSEAENCFYCKHRKGARNCKKLKSNTIKIEYAYTCNFWEQHPTFKKLDT